MKRRQSVKTLIQNPFPFPFNSPPRRLKLASLFFPFCQFPFPFRHLLCRLLYTEGQQILKLRRHLTDHCSQYVFLLIRIKENFRKVHACYTCLCYSGIVRGRLSPSSTVDEHSRRFMYRNTSGPQDIYSFYSLQLLITDRERTRQQIVI